MLDRKTLLQLALIKLDRLDELHAAGETDGEEYLVESVNFFADVDEYARQLDTERENALRLIREWIGDTSPALLELVALTSVSR